MPSEDPASVSEASQAIGTLCPDWGCGINSPQIDNSFFHDLNLDGLTNLEGYSLTGARKGSALYDLDVQNARMTARLRLGAAGSPLTLSGEALEGLELALRRVHPTTGVTTNYTVLVSQVNRYVEFRANPPGSATPPAMGRQVLPPRRPPLARPCADGEVLASDGPAAMAKNMALVFEGERIHAKHKTIAPTLGFAVVQHRLRRERGREAAPLWPHPGVAGRGVRDDDRRAPDDAGGAFRGDYCGTGKPYAGRGPAARLGGRPPHDGDAAVDPEGHRSPVDGQRRGLPEHARVAAHPSDDSIAAFPDGVEHAIAAECTLARRGARRSMPSTT